MTASAQTSPHQHAVRATYMRGGTSKGVFFVLGDLPDAVRTHGPQRDHFLLRVIGSPDPYERQIDGMGGATSSTSKVALISRSKQPDCDVDYLFGAVSIDKPFIDWSGNCGNLLAAVGPFAIERGLVGVPAEGIATVRIWQANIGKRIIARVPVSGGRVAEIGDFELDGVTFAAAEVQLTFLDPAGGEGDEAGVLFPTGSAIDLLDVPGVGRIEATLINAGNPTIFVDAEAIGLTGRELQGEVNGDSALLTRLESIRACGAVAMGLAATMQEATESRPATPKIAFVAAPMAYTASSGKRVRVEDIDLLVRIVSMGKLHHALTGTGAVAVAAAGATRGTLLARRMPIATSGAMRIGHPAGMLRVGAEVREENGAWRVATVVLSRSARRLMDGWVYVPEEIAAMRGMAPQSINERSS